MGNPNGWTPGEEQGFQQWAAQRNVPLGGLEEALFDYRGQYRENNHPDLTSDKKKLPKELKDILDTIGYDTKEKKLSLYKDGNNQINLRKGSPLGLFFDRKF